ncbi:MAG: transglutaminase-like cysteine peptidase [Candidatus Omnitrophica bacterium]|nr:transglutaminase-like cysteine peptidase [Candidatus Omnitrophota bacterium]
MKKYHTIFFLFVFLISTIFPFQSANAQTITPGYFHQLADELKTPDQIARYMWKNFTVESDQRQFGQEEYWQSPDQMLETKRGDCEDFAMFAAEMLKKNGFSSFLINVYGDRYAHTVAVFKENGVYHVIDGTDVKRYNAQSLDELFSKLYPFWKKGAIVTASHKTHRGQVLKMIERRVNNYQSMAAAV